MDDPAADRLSLLESLAARLARATAKLPPRADGAADARGAGAGADADANAAGRVSNAAGAARPPSSSSPLEIGDLVSVADAILPFFDKMGPVFHVARGEFHGKVQAVRAAGPGHLPLRDLVAADVAAQRATAKGSATRSLHRLGGTLLFIKVLFERLLVAGGGMHHSVPAEGRSPRAAAAAAADEGGGGGGGAAAAAAAADEGGGGGGGFAGMMRRLSGAGGFSGGGGGSTLVTLREAAGEAYEEALAPWHTVRDCFSFFFLGAAAGAAADRSSPLSLEFPYPPPIPRENAAQHTNSS